MLKIKKLLLYIVVIGGLFFQIQTMMDDVLMIDVSDTSDSGTNSAKTTPDPSDSTSPKWSDIESDSDYSMSEEEGDDDDDEEDSESKIEQHISEQLGTTPATVDDKKSQKISAGENLYWSLVALATPLDEDICVKWKHAQWEARGRTVHKDGAFGLAMLGNIIKKYNIGSNHDAEYRVSVRDAALIMALWCRNLPIMKALFIGGATLRPENNEFQLCLMRDYNDDEQSVLHMAACEAEKEIFDILLGAIDFWANKKLKENIRSVTAARKIYQMTDNNGFNPLHCLCMSSKADLILSSDQRREMALALIQRGTPVDVEDNYDYFPWHYAYATKKQELFELMKPLFIKCQAKFHEKPEAEMAKKFSLMNIDDSSNEQS